ncbi:MAG: MerR family transcriptional regulator [Lachnospiraceae bacterium]|jgi:DNA-binding transcriptional MerR regulator|nr:MerR family transcriptional regulator [Lachnospiraceae bacterium]
MTINEVSQRYGITSSTLRYYERSGMIPPVSRTAGGTRCYQEEDLRWVELALCMRSAGLPVEGITEYVRLTQLGDSTLTERLDLLRRQREVLKEQQAQILATMERLNDKIARYEETMKAKGLIPVCSEHS